MSDAYTILEVIPAEGLCLSVIKSHTTLWSKTTSQVQRAERGEGPWLSFPTWETAKPPVAIPRTLRVGGSAQRPSEAAAGKRFEFIHAWKRDGIKLNFESPAPF